MPAVETPAIGEDRRADPLGPTYNARWGYHTIDVERWERRRYWGPFRHLARLAIERAVVRALADVPAGARVLDAACGTAILAPVLGQAGYRVVGADVSAAMLEVGMRRLGLGAVQCDVERLPLRNACVDAVVCTRFLSHLPERRRSIVLSELGRVSTGPIVVTISNKRTLKNAMRTVRKFFGSRRPRSTRWLSPVVLAGEAASVGLDVRAVSRVAPFLSSTLVVVLTPHPRTAMLA